MRSLALALALFFLASLAVGADIITICKKTTPAGGTGFPFVWTNGTSGPTTPFTLGDGQCKPFDITQLDHFNKFTESVPAGWTLTNISCVKTTSALWIEGADPNPAFQPGDNSVRMDVNEPSVTCTFTNERQTTEPQMDVYAVKFLCGSFQPKPLQHPPNGVEYPVKPGNYLTAINVHNPNRVPVKFRKKAVLLYRADQTFKPEQPMPPGKRIETGLEPDWGMEIDCADIRQVLLQGNTTAHTFIKGWVVIEVLDAADPLKLDVTAVYTSHGWQLTGTKWIYQGFAEDVEQVWPKRVR